jgi:dUTP pyrophosphatase
MKVRIKRLADVPLPCRQTPGSAGFDLCATEEIVIPAHGFGSVGTGLAIELPERAEAQVRPRSGLATKHGIGVLNSPGTIDSDYRGEVKVVLFNTSDRDYKIHRGDRIAQIVFSILADVELVETDSLSQTSRGPGGFGHTGRA